MSFADNFCKQFGPRLGPTQCRAWSGSKLFDTLIAFQKEFFEKLGFEKNQLTTKKHAKLPSRQRDNDVSKRWNEFCVNSLFHSKSKIGEEQQPTWRTAHIQEKLGLILWIIKWVQIFFPASKHTHDQGWFYNFSYVTTKTGYYTFNT